MEFECTYENVCWMKNPMDFLYMFSFDECMMNCFLEGLFIKFSCWKLGVTTVPKPMVPGLEPPVLGSIFKEPEPNLYRDGSLTVLGTAGSSGSGSTKRFQ